jgi:hypothetical protein
VAMSSLKIFSKLMDRTAEESHIFVYIFIYFCLVSYQSATIMVSAVDKHTAYL